MPEVIHGKLLLKAISCQAIGCKHEGSYWQWKFVFQLNELNNREKSILYHCLWVNLFWCFCRSQFLQNVLSNLTMTSRDWSIPLNWQEYRLPQVFHIVVVYFFHPGNLYVHSAYNVDHFDSRFKKLFTCNHFHSRSLQTQKSIKTYSSISTGDNGIFSLSIDRIWWRNCNAFNNIYWK